MTESLTIPDAGEWLCLSDTPHENPKPLGHTVNELNRIVEFYGVTSEPSFEQVIADVRKMPHNKNDCGHAPGFDQVAYTVLINLIGESIVEHMNPELKDRFWAHCKRSTS